MNPRTKRKIRVGGATFAKIVDTVIFSGKDERLLQTLGYAREARKKGKGGDREPSKKAAVKVGSCKTGCVDGWDCWEPTGRCRKRAKPPPAVTKPPPMFEGEARTEQVVDVNFADMTSRKAHAERVSAYLADVPKCLTVGGRMITLGDKLVLPKRIETSSGFAFVAAKPLNAITSQAFRVAAKVARMNADAQNEIDILKCISKKVLCGAMPHFPIMFKALACPKAACKKGPDCHELLKKRYLMTLSELASGDLWMWTKVDSLRSSAAYRSMLMQISIALSAFHDMGFMHNAVHPSNILYHDVRPGGYWHYRVCGEDVYVENTGELWILWDFSLARREEINMADHRNLFEWFGFRERTDPISVAVPDIVKSANRMALELQGPYLEGRDAPLAYLESLPGRLPSVPRHEVLNERPFVVGAPRVQ